MSLLRRLNSAISARAVVLLFVVAAHLMALLILPLPGRYQLHPSAEGIATLVFFLPPAPQVPRAVHEPARKPTRQPARKPRPKEPTLQQEPMWLGPAADSSSTPTSIDWEQEARRAAADTLQAHDLTARQESALNPQRADIGSPQPPKAHQFGWSHARTHRVEPIPGGGFLININDRCAIVVALMFLPICKVGKIEARGDLFHNMDKDPSQP